MRKVLLFVLIVIAVLLLVSRPVRSGYLNSLQSLWFYGAPRSWGALGYDVSGKAIETAEDSTATFYAWADKIQGMVGRSLDLHADLILFSDRGYNRLVEKTAVLIFAEADKRKVNARVSINISVPDKWTVSDLKQEVDTIFSGKSGYLSLDFLRAYGDRLDLSIDFEPPVFYKNLYLTSGEINRLYQNYADTRVLWQTTSDSDKLKMYVYNFGNMFAKPEELSSKVIVMFNGVTDQKDALATMYRNENQVAERPVGIMIFVLPHLGRGQRLGSFGKGDLQAVIDWMVNEDINAPILGFQ